MLNIAQGTTALTGTGGPLQSITVQEACFDLPPLPEGGHIIGCAYDYQPNGATFSPPITITLKYNPSLIPAGIDESKLVIAYYDTATSKLVTLPSLVDTVNHTVSAQVSHLTLFAVYAAASATTPTPTITPTVTSTPTPTQTPVTTGVRVPWSTVGAIALGVTGLAAIILLFIALRRKTPEDNGSV